MTGGQSFLVPDGRAVVIDGPLLGAVARGLELYGREVTGNAGRLRPELADLRDKCRLGEVQHAIHRERTANGRDARTTADEGAHWSREDNVLTTGQVAVELYHSASYVRRLMRDHGIPPHGRVGNSLLWTRAQVALLKNRMETP